MRSLLLTGAATAALLAAGAALAEGAGPAGSYTGKATKGTTTADGKGRKVAFVVKLQPQCPTGDSSFRKSLCLSFAPSISMPVSCTQSNDADPAVKTVKERRGVPYSAAVSAAGRVKYTTKSAGPGYTATTRLVATLSGGRATGYATFESHARSSILTGDCTGRLEFTATRTGG